MLMHKARIIGKWVKIPYGPAAVLAELCYENVTA